MTEPSGAGSAGAAVPGARGYLTLAVRRRSYLEMAADMALSLREHSDLPVAVACDAKLTTIAREEFAGVFDHVVPVAERFGVHRAMQFSAAEATPFEHTLFIDADCLVLAAPDPFWADLGEQDVVMVGEWLRPGEDRRHHGFSTDDLQRRFGLDGYLKTNAGVFYLRKSRARPLLEECLDTYVGEILPELGVGSGGWLGITARSLLGGFLGAELAFGVVGGRRGFGTFDPPGPMYWPDELAVLDPAAPWKPICHMIGPLSRPALEHVLAGTERRRAAAGLPSRGGRHWRDEDRKLRRSAAGS